MAKKDIAVADKLLHSAEDAAAILDMGKETLITLAKHNFIPRIEIGTHKKFYIEDMHELCRMLRNKGIDPKAPTNEIIRNLI